MEDLKKRFVNDFKKSSFYTRNMEQHYQDYWNELFEFYNQHHGSTYWGAVMDAAKECGCPIET